MSCQFLISRSFSMLKNLKQKGYLPGRAIADGKCDTRLRNPASTYLRTFAGRTGASHVECLLDAPATPHGSHVVRQLTAVCHTPFAVIPLQPSHMHTSTSTTALRDVFGFSRPKSPSNEDSGMKEVTTAIQQLSRDPLLQYASLEPKLGSLGTSSVVSTGELKMESPDALLSYVRLAQESSLRPPSSARISPEDEDLKTLEGFASLGDRKDD